MAWSAAAPSAAVASATSRVPPQAGHMPYGKANPSLTFPHPRQRQRSSWPPQQRYSSPSSTGRRQRGQVLADADADSGPIATAPAAGGAWNRATSSAVMGHFFPLER